MTFLPPGSDEAIKAGCKCPVLDNCHGRGYYGRRGVYVFNANCELHHPDYERAVKEENK